jgi:hypothetical protein
MRCLARIAVLLMILARPLSADTPITLKIYPAISTAPSTIRVTVVVPRDPHNRQVCLTIDGENYYRSSCWEHGGEAPYQTVIYYADVPAGHYSAIAELTKEGRTIVRTPLMTFRVIGMGEEPEPDEP